MPSQTLPDLPPGAWQEEILEAHRRLSYGYESSCAALTQYDIDPGRLRSLRSRIDTHHLPVLHALERDGRVGQHWVSTVGSLFIALMPLLDAACKLAEKEERSRIRFPEIIHTAHSGRRGRPGIVVDDAWLRNNISNHKNLSIRKLARRLNIDRRTLKKEMDRVGVTRTFSNITDDQLDEIFRAARAESPQEGWSYFTGILRSAGLRVQQSRVRASISRVAPLRQALRPPVGVPRLYEVKRPNSVWHHDGYHKLIRWGFVIHGFADGYDHLVRSIYLPKRYLTSQIVGMRVNTNNRAETVFSVFDGAVQEHGSPSRARGDRGGENVAVAVWMIMKKGAKRGSYLWGSSTRNTRIERLWREVGEKFARQWKAFFTRLERLHCLDSEDPRHIWLLHFLFLVELRATCDSFVQTWNHHPMKGQNYMSPIDKRTDGFLQHGEFADDLVDVDPGEILRYYSVDRSYTYDDDDFDVDVVHSPDDGNEHEDEDEEALADDEYDMEELELLVEHGEQGNIRHDAIEAPRATCPFDNTQLRIFETAMMNVSTGDVQIPSGYNLLSEERAGQAYPIVEIIQVVGKNAEIELALDRWLPRAVRWACALELMDQILS